MQQKTVTKRFYFSDGITSLPLSHTYLKDLNDYKEEKGQRIEKYKLLAMESKAQLTNERLSIYRQILSAPVQYFSLNQKDNFSEKKQNILKDTCDIVLNSLWM